MPLPTVCYSFPLLRCSSVYLFFIYFLFKKDKFSPEAGNILKGDEKRGEEEEAEEALVQGLLCIVWLHTNSFHESFAQLVLSERCSHPPLLNQASANTSAMGEADILACAYKQQHKD